MTEFAEWDVLDWQVFEAFDDLDSFIKELSSHLDATFTVRRERAEAFWGVSSDDFFQDLEEIERQVGYSFKTSLTYAVIVLAYSQTELYLKRLSDILSKVKGLPVGLKSFRGGLSERVGLFFSAFSLPPLLESEREELERVALVRNCIVHNGGIVSGSGREAQLQQLVARSQGVSLGQDQRLSISAEYCGAITKELRNMFRRLIYENFESEKPHGGV
jgi:hypothetical protein